MVPSRPFSHRELDDRFFVNSEAPYARPFNVVDSLVLMVSRHRADVLLRSAGLERCLAFFEVASVVLGTDEGEDDDVYGHTSDEDTLNQSVVRHVYSINYRAGVLSAS